MLMIFRRSFFPSLMRLMGSFANLLLCFFGHFAALFGYAVRHFAGLARHRVRLSLPFFRRFPMPAGSQQTNRQKERN